MTTSDKFHKPMHLTLLCAGALLLSAALADTDPTDAASSEAETGERKPVSVEEARGRARLLHEVIRGALQVMHRDFFDPDDRDRIPSSSLEDVFEGVSESHGVRMKWLGVNAKVMDVDHKATDDFEKRAVAVLAKGANEFESVEKNAFRYVGAIRLHNACLKCHVPFRKSLETRKAGLSISIPIRPAETDPG